MNRLRRTRSFKTRMGHFFFAVILASGVLAVPVAASAQDNQDNKKETRRESSAEERAQEAIQAARKELKRGEFAVAREQMNRAQTLDPDAPGLKELAQDIAEAEREAQLEAREKQVAQLIDQAGDYLKKDQFDQAQMEVAKALELAPANRKAQKLRDKIVREKEEARRDALEDQVDRLADAAEDAIDQNQFDKARQSLEQARQAGEGLFDKELAKLSEKIRKEEADYNRKKNKSAIKALLQQANANMKADRFELARKNATDIFALDKGNKDASKILAKIQKKEAEYKAERHEREMKQKLDEAEKLLDSGKYEEAVASYQAIAREYPGSSDAKRGLSKAQKELQKKQAEVAKAKKPQEKRQVAKAPEPKTAKPEAKTPPVAQKEKPAPASRKTEERTKSPAPEVKKQAEKPAVRQAEQKKAAESQDEKKQAREKEPTRREEERKMREQEAQKKKAQQEAERKAAQEQRGRREQAEKAYNEGLELYEKGELARARQRWLDAKELDPTYVKPDAYLENTEAEYNEYLSRQAAQRNFEQREQKALEKMETLIPFRTLKPTTLPEFLQTLRLLSGIDFVIIGEVSAKVEAAFEDEPLREVLNSTLIPMGLRWYREPGSDTVIIEPDLRTEVFSLTPDQLNTVNALIEEGVVARLLYGQAGEPVIEGQEILTDSRNSMLVMTDSKSNIEKVRRIIESLTGQARTQLVFDSYQIDESKAPEIKALLGAVLAADDDQPFNTERKLILEGETLIIKDTADNVQKARDILQDKNFLARFYTDELSVATFNLTPVIEFEDNPDLIRSFADNVRQVVETLLYAREGRTKAEREGRRIWYDPASYQLTVTDTPDRLQKVQDYIESLPQIRSRRRSKIIFLDHAAAGDLVGQIEAFLGIEGGTQRGAGGGDEQTFNVRVEDEIEFRDLTLRVTRVEENDVNDDLDDSVRFSWRTGNASGNDEQLNEFESNFFGEGGEYEIIADDIRPSSTAGQGRARLIIRYVGDTTDTGIQDEEEDDAEAEREAVKEELGLSLEAIENLNAMFIQYQNIEDLREVEFWVRTLDIPTLQVSIEVKFVEVLQNKAQQLAPDFVMGDMTEGFDFSESILRSRFAQDQDEFTNVFEPAIESFDSANLLKGTTVLSYIVNNGSSPISFTLKALEAQGVINIVNGPNVTVLNGNTVEFIIERRRYGGIAEVQTDQNQDQDNVSGDFRIEFLTPVDLTVGPTITRAGNITVDIDAEIEDLDQNLGQTTVLGQTLGEGELPSSTNPEAIRGAVRPGTLWKSIQTQARIKDGGTVVLGGWKSERVSDLESGVPILRDIPFVGKYLFNRVQKDEDKITLLIFLTGSVVRD